MPGRPANAPPDPWTVAIHRRERGQHPIGTGVVIAPDSVLTCAHVVRQEDNWLDEVWISFPKAEVPWLERRRVRRFGHHGVGRGVDLVVLELDAPVPATVTPARLRCVPAAQLTDQPWWTFGFPGGLEAGSDARGTVGAPLGFGKIRLDPSARHQLATGFSGSGVWSPTYEAVVGLVVAAAAGAPQPGSGHALTLHRADQELPELQLAKLARWSPESAGDPALTAWGAPRPRGPSDRPTGPAPAAAFHGRSEALAEVTGWLRRPESDGTVLVVTGSPGAGKSALLGRVVTAAPPHPPANGARAGALGCAVYASGKTALEVTAEIARAAGVGIPTAVEELAPALRDRLAGSGQPFPVIVDALDEMTEPGQSRHLLQAGLLPLTRTGSPPVPLVVGTRRQDSAGDLLAAFGGHARVVDLDQSPYFTSADLAGYTAATLRHASQGRPDHPYADQAVAGPVADRIAALAGRNYLIAGLVAEAHGRYDPEPVRPGQVALAPTVVAALDAYLAELPPIGDTPARVVLTVLAYAQSPGLPLPLWQAGVAALGAEVSEEQLVRFARSKAANILVATDSGPTVRAYRLFHQALSEALLRARGAAERRRDERRLVQVWLRQGQAVGWSSTYDYLLRQLPGHAARAGMVAELLADDRFMLHADLRRLGQVTGEQADGPAVARARLLQRTPQAAAADPAERAAMFATTEQLDRLGSGFAATGGAPYQARWAHTRARHERTALEGHANGVLAVCPVPLPAGPRLGSAGEDGTVRLWDPTTGATERVLTGHTDWVRSICPITVDHHTLLASASDDQTIRLWNPTTGATERILTGHTDWVRSICPITVDHHTLLASASDDQTIRLWDPATGTLIRTLGDESGWVLALSVVTVAGTALLAAASGDDQVRLWDPATGRLTATIGQPAGVTALCPVPVEGRQLLATAGYHAGVLLWDPATGDRVRELVGPRRPVTSLGTVATNGRLWVVATGEDGTIHQWDPVTGVPGPVLTGHTDWVRGACAVTAGGDQLLASASADGTVRLWDPQRDTPHRVLDGAGPVTALAPVCPPAGAGLLVSAGRDGSVRLWEPATGAAGPALVHHPAPVTAVCAVTAGGQPLVGSAGEDGTVQLCAPGAGLVRRLRVEGRPPVTALCALPGETGDRLAVASEDCRISLWDPASGQLERVVTQLWRVTALCPVPSGGQLLLAAGDEEGLVRLWEPATGEQVGEWRCHHAAITALCPVPAGDRWLLAAAGEDHTIRLWDPAAGGWLRSLTGHTGRVNDLCAAATDRGTLLVSASDDRTLRLWDPDTGATRLTIPVYHPALCCAYDSELLLVGLGAGLLALDLAGAAPAPRPGRPALAALAG